MRTVGEVIVEARKKAHLTQRQLTARIKNEDGKPISGQYLNDIEHNQRRPLRGYLLEQFVKELDLDVDLLYFLAKQLPVELDPSKISEAQGVAAYRAFRRGFNRRTGKSDDYQLDSGQERALSLAPILFSGGNGPALRADR